jgi:hypothetical protein
VTSDEYDVSLFSKDVSALVDMLDICSSNEPSLAERDCRTKGRGLFVRIFRQDFNTCLATS